MKKNCCMNHKRGHHAEHPHHTEHHHPEHSHPCHHGGRSHPPRHMHPEWMQDDSLGGVLSRCGHYFAHRVGGGKKSRVHIMTLIDRKPGITQKELAEEMGVQPASISELMMKLEGKGFVQREKDEQDRRNVKVQLTEEGRAALKQREEEKVDPFQALTAEEQDALKGLLGKLLADWEQRYPAERGKPEKKPHCRCEKEDSQPR